MFAAKGARAFSPKWRCSAAAARLTAFDSQRRNRVPGTTFPNDDAAAMLPSRALREKKKEGGTKKRIEERGSEGGGRTERESEKRCDRFSIRRKHHPARLFHCSSVPSPRCCSVNNWYSLTREDDGRPTATTTMTMTMTTTNGGSLRRARERERACSLVRDNGARGE